MSEQSVTYSTVKRAFTCALSCIPLTIRRDLLRRAGTVETVRLSDYIVEKHVSRAMVKVDVEGTAAQVWSGLAERFRYFVIEMI
jgi:FkbM family methyltransferase